MDTLLPLCLTLLFIGGLVAGGIFIYRSFEFVEEGTVGVVERDGRFQRILLPGRHLLLPLDRIKQQVKLQDFTWEFRAEKVQTKITVIGITMSVRYHIARAAPLRKVARSQAADLPRRRIIRLSDELAVDAESVYRAVYTVNDWQDQTKEEAKSILYQFFGGLMLKEQILDPEGALAQLSNQLTYLINLRTMRFGVQISSVNLFNLEIDPALMQALNAQRQFERLAKLRELEAQHQRKVAELLQLTPDQLLRERERQQYMETLKEISKNPNARIVVAPSLQDAGAAEMLHAQLAYNDRLPPQRPPEVYQSDDDDDEYEG